MKRLAIICGSLSRGGAERVSLSLAQYMRKRNIEVFIITGSRTENEYHVPDDIVRFSLSEGQFESRKLIYYIKKMRSLIKKNNIDTVLVMGVPLCVYAILGCFATNVKIVVSERNDPKHFAGKQSTKIISRFLMKFADAYVFQTIEAKEYYKGKLKNPGVVIWNPLETKKLPPFYSGVRDRVIVSAGRLNPQKNQKLLIDAFAEIAMVYPEYKLVIYGEGVLEKDLKKHVEMLGLTKKVLFPGNVTDLLEKINSASLFVLTSDFEGMPNALVEAMALGLPCIATDCPCGGPRELITHKENGMLCTVGNREELVESIQSIIENEEFSKLLQRNAFLVRERLDIDKIGDCWYQLLNHL